MPNDSSSPERIASHLRDVARDLAPGGRLPSTRAIAAEWGASPVTVQRAVRMLVAEGLVETRPGAGNFVRHARPAPRADYGWQTTALGPVRIDRGAVGSTLQMTPDDVLSLRESYPSDDLLPVRAVRAALRHAAGTRAASDRPPPAGLPALRAWFARELAAVTPHGGDAPTAADVLVVPGGQSALSSTFRALAAPGEAVVMEAPTFWGAIAAARLAELRIVPVAREGDAVAPAALDEALAASRAKLFYGQPRFANPSGEAWSPAQAAAIMEVLASHGAFLIEDDWAHDFSLDGPTVPVAARDVDGRVIHIRSITKSVSPALRVAAVIARGPARARIQADRTINDLYVSGVLQAAALEVLSAPGRAADVRGVHAQLRARRDELARLVRRLLPDGALPRVPAGGLNLWVRLPEDVSAAEVAERCALAGLLVSPGDEWFPSEPTGPFLRLNYAGPSPGRFEEAVRVLAGVLAA